MRTEIGNCERGDILEAGDRSWDAGRHFIIFYDQFDGHDFIGAMVTHRESRKNIQMSEHHFEKFSEDGSLYEFQYDNTKIVIAKLRKFEIWQPFYKEGKLTASGIEFVENTIDKLDLETWDAYKIRTRHIPD